MAHQDSAILRLHHRLDTCKSIDDLEAVVLSSLAGDLGSQGSSFQEVRHVLCPPTMVRGSARGVDPATDRTYRRDFHLYYPNLCPSAPKDPVAAFVLSQRERILRSPLVDTSPIWAPNRIVDAMVVRVDYRAGDSFFFCFHRQADSSPFDDDSLRHVRAMLPALSSTVMRLRCEEDLQCAERRLSDRDHLLASGQAAVVLDAELHQVYANRQGEGLLKRIGECDRSSRRLRDHCNALSLGEPDLPRFLGAAGEGVWITRSGTGKHLRFLLSQDTEQTPALDLLTPRERDIAGLAARGLCNKEIAECRSLSLYTVENHLRAIFRKLDVTSRTRLAVLLGSPSTL